MLIEEFTNDMRSFTLVTNTSVVSGIGEVSRSAGSNSTISGIMTTDTKGTQVNREVNGQLAVHVTTHKLYCSKDVVAQLDYFIVDWSSQYRIIDVQPGYLFNMWDHTVLYLIKIE